METTLRELRDHLVMLKRLAVAPRINLVLEGKKVRAKKADVLTLELNAGIERIETVLRMKAS